MSNMGDHVTCDECGRTYQWTAWDEHYETETGRHLDETCLMTELGKPDLLYLFEQDDGSLAGPIEPIGTEHERSEA